MESLKIFEAGIRHDSGEYSKLIRSESRKDVEDHMKIIRHLVDERYEIVFFVKVYHLVSTTPYIIREQT